MERTMKVQPSQVEDFLKGNDDPVTVKKLADEFDCTPQTIRNKCRALRREGKPILPTRLGIISAEKVTDEELAKLVMGCLDWAVASLVNLSGIAAVGKRPLIQAGKILKLPEERKKARALLMMVVHAIDIIDIDHQLEG